MAAEEEAPRRNLHSKATRLFLVHMIFMILAWLLLAPAAILLARFGRTLFKWYPHHRNINILTLIFVIIGFATAVAAMMTTHSPQFTETHHQVGLAIFILVFVQSALGLAAHRIRARPSGHRFLGLIHAPIGLLLFGLSVWNIETGFDLWEWDAGNAPKIFVYVWMGVLIALYLGGLLLIPKEIKYDRAQAEEKEKIIKDSPRNISPVSTLRPVEPVTSDKTDLEKQKQSTGTVAT